MNNESSDTARTRSLETLEARIDSPAAVALEFDIYHRFPDGAMDGKEHAASVIPTQVRVPIGYTQSELPLILALQSPELAATGFMAWGYGALADLLEAGGDESALLMAIAQDDLTRRRWQVIVDEHAPYDPSRDLPRLARRFFPEGEHHD